MTTLEQTGAVSSRDKSVLREATEVLRRYLPDAKALVYGSVARGEKGPQSDYDILVLTQETLDAQQEEAVRDAVLDVEMRSGSVISVQFIPEAFWDRHPLMPFHVEVERDAVLLL